MDGDMTALTEKRLDLQRRIATMEWDKGRNQLHEAQCVKLKVFKEELQNLENKLGLQEASVEAL